MRTEPNERTGETHQVIRTTGSKATTDQDEQNTTEHLQNFQTKPKVEHRGANRRLRHTGNKGGRTGKEP